MIKRHGNYQSLMHRIHNMLAGVVLKEKEMRKEMHKHVIANQASTHFPLYSSIHLVMYAEGRSPGAYSADCGRHSIAAVHAHH